MRQAIAVVAAGLCFGTSLAILPPNTSDWERWSRNKAYVVTLSYEKQEITVFAVRQDGARKKLWSMHGWYGGGVELSNDGRCLQLPGHWGHVDVGRLPRGDEIMMTLVKRGRVVATVRLSDLYSDFSKIRKFQHALPDGTLAPWYSYSWGYDVSDHFDEENGWVLQTEEGNVFVLSCEDGELRLKAKASPPPATPK